jgi:hypothetical protein
MMNCFEARQDFVGFWQRALDGERRRELLVHFEGCAKCDRAFRAFALTAPMLHSKGAVADEAVAGGDRISATPHVEQSTPRHASSSMPIDMNGMRRADARRAAEILRRASVYRLAERRPSRQWRDAAAGLSAVVAAVLLAYFSVAAPSQSFDDALISPDSISETAAQPDTDFLGQQMPSMPAASSDLAG